MAGPQPIDDDAFDELLDSGAIRQIGHDKLDLSRLDAAARSAVIQYVQGKQARREARRAKFFQEGREEERAAGLRPKRGRPRKHFGPRELNGRASRRKTDAEATISRMADALWQVVAQGRGGAQSRWWRGRGEWDLRAPPVDDPLFLNLARRGELDIESFAKALLWWATKYSTLNKHLLFKVICGKLPSEELRDKAEELDAQTTEERRQIALLELGDDFVSRLDAAIFDNKISDVESLKRDLMAVWRVWCSWGCNYNAVAGADLIVRRKKRSHAGRG
jgi:hypothetical protein